MGAHDTRQDLPRDRHHGATFLSVLAAALSPALLLALVPALLIGARPATSQSQENAPWEIVRAVRESLADRPVAADFIQTFVPAGFTNGERESGRVALALPDCLRWDYSVPYPKSYLVCGDEVWAWNPGEASGRHHQMEPDEERGLDLLRLSADDLSSRYRAHVEAQGRERVEIGLEPVKGLAEITGAFLVFDAALTRLMAFRIEDAEGNVTRFELSGYRPIEGREPFIAPTDLDWLDD